MNTNRRIALGFLSLLFLLTQSSPLQASLLSTGWHWFVTCSGSMSSGIQRLLPLSTGVRKQLKKKYPAAPKEIMAMIEPIIKKYGLDPQDFIIFDAPEAKNHFALAMGTNIILVDSATFATIDPEEAEFIIAHELSHLHQRHNVIFGLACLIFPFVAHACLRLWDTGVQKVTAGTNNVFVQKVAGANSWVSNFCLTKAFLATSFSFLLSQHHEKQADLLALQKTNCHQGGYKFMEHIRQINLTAKKERPELATLISEDGDLTTDYNHPAIDRRLAYMQADERARKSAHKQLS